MFIFRYLFGFVHNIKDNVGKILHGVKENMAQVPAGEIQLNQVNVHRRILEAIRWFIISSRLTERRRDIWQLHGTWRTKLATESYVLADLRKIGDGNVGLLGILANCEHSTVVEMADDEKQFRDGRRREIVPRVGKLSTMGGDAQQTSCGFYYANKECTKSSRGAQ